MPSHSHHVQVHAACYTWHPTGGPVVVDSRVGTMEKKAKGADRVPGDAGGARDRWSDRSRGLSGWVSRPAPPFRTQSRGSVHTTPHTSADEAPRSLVTTAGGETNRLDSAPRPWPARVTQLAGRCSVFQSVASRCQGTAILTGRAPARGCGRCALSRHPWPVRFGRHGARKKKQTMSHVRGPDKGGAAGLLGWDTWMPPTGAQKGG